MIPLPLSYILSVRCDTCLLDVCFYELENSDSSFGVYYTSSWVTHCISPLMLSHLTHVQVFATQWTVTCQAPLSVGFPRQEYWSGLPCPSPGNFPVCVYLHHIFLIYLSVNGHLGYFHISAIVNSAAMNIGVHVFF